MLSLIAHPLAVAAFIGISYLTRTERPPRVETRPVTMRTMSAKQWNKNRGSAQLPEKPAELHPKGQVVDVAPGNDRISPDAKYLAETNNKVEKQTRAREQSQKYSVATAKPTPNPEQMPSARGKQSATAPQAVSLTSKLEEENEFGGRRPRLGSLLNSALAKEEHNESSTPSAGEAERGAQTDTPAVGGGAPNDNLNDVAAGEGTYLNTREWKYAQFFNRVKQAVSAKWDPNGRLKQKDAAGKYMAEKTTVLGVTLRPDGSIADIYVVKTCGVDYLDAEAVGAFERAAPFLNPPAALVENGFIRFAFSFTLSPESGFMPRFSGRPVGP